MKKNVLILMAMFILSLMSCENKEEKLTIKNIEIFKNTPVWDLAKALDKSNLRKAKKIVSENGDLVNYQDPIFGTTLLMRAISRGNYKAVEFLLQNGANPNIISKTGLTALFSAVFYSWSHIPAKRNSKFAKILLNHGADPNIPYCSRKIEGGTDPIECGTSPLMLFALSGLEETKLLVDAGATIDYKTELGRTAAIDALMMRKVDVAHYLIVEKKARVNEPYYFYYFHDRSKINYEDPHLPINLLEDWLFKLDSKEHKLKMEIVEEFKRQGQDYWSIEKHPKTIERIKKLYPDKWENYLKKY